MKQTMNNANVANSTEVNTNVANPTGAVEMHKTVRSDLFKVDPRAVRIIDGFNSRVDFGDIEELAKQINENGMLNPITVRKAEVDENGNQMYELIDGERRYRAVKYLMEHGKEIARISAFLVNKNISKSDMMLQQIMRNEGKPFNEYEYGIAYQKLIDAGFTRDEITKKCGKNNRWHVDCCLKHLERDERIQEMLRKNEIKGTEVRQIYQAHKNDKGGAEPGAVAEILEARKKAVAKAKATESKATDSKGKKVDAKPTKVTLSDLDSQSKTILKRDSVIIKKGLETLFKYYNKATNNGKVEIELDVVEVLGKLKADANKNILDILNEYKTKDVA